ncbi:histone-lysine N-methyltransferase SETMAR [Trichonephila clavipes]|nr:histone-lysine N-methyltransferase SETMAR [Trichonephila clavipes]
MNILAAKTNSFIAEVAFSADILIGLRRLSFLFRKSSECQKVLKERNFCRRVDVCDLLLRHQENDPFLKCIITRGEKWVVYNNVKRKRSWSEKDEPAQSIPKANIHQKRTATARSDLVQTGRPIFDDFFQHLWPYIGNNTANVVFQMVKHLWLIRIDQ